ncbi:hypothetical protein A0H81_14256 [Grifola frondosa]|uniref:F-box domain-containing protein n=1 Tax=Grifola frondosa TaxID=5627 RepID=A0A1C7LP58_GRIFR|nr:hypothetical protein A0H81_14256 [Grifola frondosa]
MHAYMLSDIPNRARRIVDLTIIQYRVESQLTILAKDLLTEAVNLRKLCLDAMFLQLDPRIGDALAALQRLQFVWFTGIPNDCCFSTLPRMRSNPSRIHLTDIDYHEAGIYSSILSSLASFTNLRTLRLADIFESSLESDAAPLGSWTKLPQVQCLILADCNIPWSNFVDSLPNVRSLEIQYTNPEIEIDRKFWPELRRLNIYRPFDICIVDALCPVHWLIIALPLDINPEPDYGYKYPDEEDWELEPLNAIRAALPMVFCFTVTSSVDTTMLEDLIETGLQRLTLVDVNLLLNDDPDGIQWLAANICVLHLVPVVCLRALIKPPRTQWTIRLDEMLKKAVSTMLRATAPSLRYFAFALDHSSTLDGEEPEYIDDCHQGNRFTWWQITGTEAAREVREIPTWQGERVRQYLLDVESITELDWDDAFVAQTDVNWTSGRAPLPPTSSWPWRSP